MEPVAYKNNALEVVERLRALYERRAQDRIFAAFHVPSEALAQFRAQHGEGFCEYPDLAERLDFWDAYLREGVTLQDDSMPTAYLSELDQGLYGGLVGGDVRFMRSDNGFISSMVPPILHDWDGLDGLEFSESHPWVQRYLDQLRVFVQRAEGKFGISHLILIDGLNFAFELVGATNTYMSLIEEPEAVRRAIEFGFDLNVWVQRTFFEHVPLYSGGTFSNMLQWIPGRIVSESVDPFHMMSPSYFEEWGRENAERVFAAFDGGAVHIHGNGRHLLEAVSSVVGLKAICLEDDKGIPLAFDVLPELRRRTGNMPLTVGVGFQRFVEALQRKELPGGVMYRVGNVPGIEEANRRMDQVREYRV
jgi:hypothetical protein